MLYVKNLLLVAFCLLAVSIHALNGERLSKYPSSSERDENLSELSSGADEMNDDETSNESSFDALIKRGLPRMGKRSNLKTNDDDALEKLYQDLILRKLEHSRGGFHFNNEEKRALPRMGKRALPRMGRSNQFYPRKLRGLPRMG